MMIGTSRWRGSERKMRVISSPSGAPMWKSSTKQSTSLSALQASASSELENGWATALGSASTTSRSTNSDVALSSTTTTFWDIRGIQRHPLSLPFREINLISLRSACAWPAWRLVRGARHLREVEEVVERPAEDAAAQQRAHDRGRKDDAFVVL